MLRSTTAVLSAALLMTGVLLAAAQDAITITKPQKAAVLTQSGKLYVGVLIELTDKGVKFQPRNMGLFTFKPGQVKAVQTQDRLLIYSAEKQRFEPANQPPPAAGDAPFDLAAPAKTAEKATQAVVAEGAGATPQAALKDAFRNAVQQVVGAVVDSETLIKNDEVISDQVLTYSDGFIKTHKKISEAERDGLHRVKIAAEVERRGIVAKLKAAKVTTREIDGESLFGEITSQLEAAKYAKAIFDQAFKEFPFGCLEAEVLGNPEVLERDESKVKYNIHLRFQVNPKAYAVAAARLQQALKAISLTSGQFVMAYKPAVNRGVAVPGLFEPVDRNHLWQKMMPRAFGEPEPKHVVLAVTTNINQIKDRTVWSYYIIDETARTSLLNLALREPKAKLSFLDRDGELITSDQFSSASLTPDGELKVKVLPHFNVNPLAPMTFGGTILDGTLLQRLTDSRGGYRSTPRSKLGSEPAGEWVEKNRGASWFLFSPMLFERQVREFPRDYNTSRYLAQISHARAMTLTLDEVQRLRRIRCEITFE